MAGPGIANATGALGMMGGLEELIASRLMAQKVQTMQAQQQAQEYEGRLRAVADRTGKSDKQTAETAKLRAEADDIGQKRIRAFNAAPVDAAEKTRQFDVTSGEVGRHNAATEGLTASGQAETGRHNITAEGLTASGQAEAGRHNRVAEGISARVAGAAHGTKIVQGADDQGRPASFLIDSEGNIVKTYTKAPTAAEHSAAVDADASANSVQAIRDLYKPEYVGPISGRLNNVSTKTGIKLTPNVAKFSAAVAHMKNQVIHEITGAAVGVQEEGRIMGEIPDLTDPPEMFEAKMEQTERNRQYLQQRRAKRSGGAPGAVPGPGGVGAGTPKGSVLKFDAQGNLVP